MGRKPHFYVHVGFDMSREERISTHVSPAGATMKSVVPQGYKQTEVGVIPEDWKVKPIGDFASISVGRDLREENYSAFQDEIFKYPVFSNTVSNEGLYGYYNISEYSGDSLTVVGRGVGFGTAFKRSGGYGAIGRLLVLFPEPNVDAEYLTEYINDRVKIFTESGGIPQLTGISISKYRIPLPPTKAEQEAIAEALFDADALIESLEQLITKKSHIKQGTMQELLTGKKRLPGFSGKWEAKNLGDIIEKFIGGGTPSRSNPQYWGDEIPWVTVKDFATFNPHYSQEAITRTGLQNSASHLIPKGTLITSTRMALGKAVVYEVDVAINQDLKALFPKPVLKTQYLYFWFQYHWQSIDELGSGSTVKGISLHDLKKIEFLLPPLLEQTAIATILSDMDAEIAALDEKLAKTKKIKQGMMQELLTGRIRLVSPTAKVIPFPTKKKPATVTNTHNWEINEAVIIGVLAKNFGSEKYPLARKRCTKLTYLLHRHAEGKAEGYLKKAAGPYNPRTRYSGPEKIAQKNRYVRACHNGTYEGFVATDNVVKAEAYFQQWYGSDALAWLERFRYHKTDELELLATVDMAMEELKGHTRPTTLETVKRVIHDHPEWNAKLDRETFSDDNIERAIQTCREFFL